MAKVADLMRKQFVQVDPAESLLEADQILRLARIRHLPVVREGELVGILTRRDVMEAALSRLDERGPDARLEHLRSVSVEEVMTRDVETATPGMELGDAAVLMLRHKIGCLPVVGSRKRPLHAIGLITEADLVRAAYAPDFLAASD
jgi:CBS domain-containing protein